MGPVCSGADLDCPCATLACLDGGYPVEVATVTDRDDLDTADLMAAVLTCLDQLGWGGGPDARAVAADIATDIADIAASFDIGTTLRASYSHRTEVWTFTPESA